MLAVMWAINLFFLLSIVFVFANCEVLKKISDDAESCESICDKTYPLHTYPKAEHLQSCRRGCRLFTLISISHTISDLNQTLSACVNACSEAYPESHATHYACNLGCNNQFTQAESREKTGEQHIHALTPLLLVHQMYESVMDHMCKFLQTSFWAVYVQEDNGNVVVVRGELDPGQMTEMEAERGEASENQLDTSVISRLCRTSDGPCFSEMPDAQSKSQNQQKSWMFGSKWLDCISRQSGIPRWLLVMVLFLVIVTMVWLCCATMVTSPVHHYKSQKLSINGDFDYLLLYDPSEHKIQPSVDVEAPPLPVKVPLNQI